MCVLKVLPMCVPAAHPGPLPSEGERENPRPLTVVAHVRDDPLCKAQLLLILIYAPLSAVSGINTMIRIKTIKTGAKN
jgi:hypothetical protein